MIRKIQRTIKTRALLKDGQHVLIAISGGADSVALTYALHHLRKAHRLKLTLAHLHHSIRGQDADEDARFVRELAMKLGLPCELDQVDVPALATRKGLSLEMTARMVRYDFMARVARECGADVLATGHTADDQAETILLKLARGAGPQGLAGISYRGEWKGLPVIRPIRDVTHAQACAFLRRHGLSWREDNSNQSLHFLRNRVRHVVLPVLEKQLNPGIREVLARTAEVMSEENAWLDDLARERLSKCISTPMPAVLLIPPWRQEHLAARRRMIRLWLVDRGIPSETIDYAAVERIMEIMESSEGTRTIPLMGGWEVSRQYEELIVKRAGNTEGPGFSQKLEIPGETLLPAQGLRVITNWSQGIIRSKTAIGKFPCEATLDAQAVNKAGGAIFIRSWRTGDRIRPLGMSGSRKLQDLFVDAKIPREHRSFVPLLESRGEIIWVAGYRVAQGWEVRNPTEKCLRVLIERI
jgi:tRNA(Ile)-lysidine synthase